MKPAAEIRDPIHGYIYLTNVEREVIDTHAFQRLRRIRQLAGAHLTYPGGQHSRFEHSVGSLYLADLAGHHLSKQTGCSDDDIQMLRLAALLHDVGHGPFSHVFEEVMTEKKGITHEDLTRRIVEETEIRDVLLRHGFKPGEVSQLATGRSSRSQFWNDLIGGGLSVDVMDYLLRDSYFTGVEYGKVDVHRIINSYSVVDGRLALDSAALYAFEALIIARYEMFRAVYFHRTVRAAEIMMASSMELADDELRLTDTSNLERFLSMTDESVLEALTELDPKDEPKLARARDLAIGYRDRRLLKCAFERVVQAKDRLLESIFSEARIRHEIARRIAEDAHVNPEEVYVDVPTTPSVPYTALREALSSVILVSRSAKGTKHEIVPVEELPLVRTIIGFFDILRVYTLQQQRVKVEKAAEHFFGKEGFMTQISI